MTGTEHVQGESTGLRTDLLEQAATHAWLDLGRAFQEDRTALGKDVKPGKCGACTEHAAPVGPLRAANSSE